MTSLQKRIKAGQEGKYKGLSNGLNRINEFIFGIQRGCMILLGGMSGTFKTTLLDFMLINAMLDAEKQGIKLTVHYYSFEIDEVTKKCNWLSVIIYQKYKVIIPPKKIKGLGENRLTPDEQLLVDNCIPDLEEVWSKIHFAFQPVNPTGIYNDLWKFMEKKGKFEYEPYVDHKTGETKQKIKQFIPDDPDAYNLVAVDHIYLLKKERGMDPKQVMDKYSEYCMELRNMFGYTFINLQQFNDGLSNVDRMKFKGVDLSPQMSDFKDTRNLYQDSDIVLGTMNPAKLDMDECLGYKMDKIDKMLMLKILKNRLDEDHIAIGLQANPQAGSFIELPDPDKIDYNKFK